MDLYFSPLACSMASRITAYEAGAEDALRLVPVSRQKLTGDGQDFRSINPLGQVPVLRTDDGDLIFENAAILTYLADAFPEAGLGPASGIERYRLAQWLGFIGTELHKAVFTPLFATAADEGAKAFARHVAAPRLALLDAHLEGRDFLLDHFSVADAYLTAVLNWAPFVKLDLAPYSAITAYEARMKARPAVARALADEQALLQAA